MLLVFCQCLHSDKPDDEVGRCSELYPSKIKAAGCGQQRIDDCSTEESTRALKHNILQTVGCVFIV